MDTIDPQKIVESVKTGDNGGMIKSVTDIKIEKLEARLNELEKINSELRTANAELYAIASSKEVPGKNGGGTTDRSGGLASAQVLKDDSAEKERAIRENQMLEAVLKDMGYRRDDSQSIVTNTATSKVGDGM